MPALIIPSFARGELAPGLHGRVDTAAYHVGLATARNMFIHSTGGASNRPGLQFIAPSANHSGTSQLIPFQFKTTDTYMLEFGPGYMRVIRNDASVLEAAKTITDITQTSPAIVSSTAHGFSDGDEVFIANVVGMLEINGLRAIVANKNDDDFELVHQENSAEAFDTTSYLSYASGGTVSRVYEIATPYQQADLNELKFVQSADVLTITHRLYAPRELAREDHDDWTLVEISYAPTQDHPIDAAATAGGSTGSDTYEYKVTAIADETLEESLAALSTVSKTITDATQTNPVVVTATAHGFTDGNEIEIDGIVGMVELNGRRFKVANKNDDDFELKGEDGINHTAYVSDGTAGQTHVFVTDGNATLSDSAYVDIDWSETIDAQRYAVYRRKDGLYGLIGETEELTFRDDGKTPDLDSSPPRATEPFLGADNKPGTVSFYEQRQVHGGSTRKPDTSVYSQTGNFKNLSVSTPAKADDAITATLNSQEVNEIRHYIPLNDLLTLTSGEEWRVNSGDNSGFAAATLRQRPQSRWGSSHRRPVTIGSTVLYVQEDNRRVRSIGYTLEVDGYTGTDMTLLAGHLFRLHSITGFAYAKGVDSLVAATRADGVAGVMTFQQEQEIIAWARWDTAGWFETVAAIRPSAAEPDQAFYFMVRRIINGRTVRYIERAHSRRFANVRECFFVDSGSSVDVPVTISGVTLANPAVVTATAHGFSEGEETDINDVEWVTTEDDMGNQEQPDQLNGRRFTTQNITTDTFELIDDEGVVVDSTLFNAYVQGGAARATFSTISGLHHLEGETLVALADGNVVRDLVVTNGEITLARNASQIHQGLAYSADIETLNIETRSATDTLQGKKKNVEKVIVRFEESRGLWIGPNKTRLLEMRQREYERYGDPTALLTGDKEITLEPNWNSNGRIFARQRDPLPMTVLAFIPIFDQEDD